MITFRTIILPGQRKADGSYTVYIRVTFKGRSRRLATSLDCRPEDLTRSRRIKSPDLLRKGDDLIRRMREAVECYTVFDLEGRDVDWVVRRIRDAIAGDGFRLDFFTYGEKVALTKTPSTRRSYYSALNALERFLGRRQLDVNEVTRALLLRFREWADAEPKQYYNFRTGETRACRSGAGKGGGAGARHLMKLAHIYDAARFQYNDEDAGRILIPRTPFDGIPRTQPPSQGQRNLGAELVGRIFRAQPQSVIEREALDVFCLSFALMGANIADLWAAKPFRGSWWEYHRQKTEKRRRDGALVRVLLQPEAQARLRVLQDGPRGWWVPALHKGDRGKDVATAMVNRGLRRWAEREGVEPFTFGAVRHSWASIARSAGIEKATVDDGLAHKGDYAVTDIYAERNWQMVADANRRVLDIVLADAGIV